MSLLCGVRAAGATLQSTTRIIPAPRFSKWKGRLGSRPYKSERKAVLHQPLQEPPRTARQGRVRGDTLPHEIVSFAHATISPEFSGLRASNRPLPLDFARGCAFQGEVA